MMYEELIKRLRTATTLPVMNDLCQQAADAIEELSIENASLWKSLHKGAELVRESRKLKWIPVTERFPPHAYGEGDSVLTISKLGVMRVLYFDGGNWCWPTGEPTRKYQITHWMPLPNPPMEDEP